MLLFAPALACASCLHETERAPTTLVDGSRPRAPALELEGMTGPAVQTRSRPADIGRLDPASPTSACLRSRARDVSPRAALERVGVFGESVTVVSSRGVYGCDASLGRRPDGRRWCSGAFGSLVQGQLGDPRLGLGCVTDRGAPIGFVWIQPVRQAKYVAVRQPGFAEVYEVIDRIPVRIASPADVEAELARATFDVAEHRSDGRLIRRYSLEAAVAG